MVYIKKIILLKTLIFLLSFKAYPQVQIETTIATLNNLSFNDIKEKEAVYKNLFDKKQKFQKAALISSGTASLIFVSYLGLNYWLKNKEIKQDKTDNKTSNIHSTETETKTDRVILNKNKSLKDASSYGFFKGIRKGTSQSVAGIISLSVLYVASDILKPLKENVINFFKTNDEELFRKSAINLAANLKNLQDVFLQESSMCSLEELTDHYNYFIETAENFLALINAIALNKIVLINNLQTIKNEQNLMYKNIFNLTEKLTSILNKSDQEIFSENMSDQILVNFKLTNNQVFRFINLAQAILYEN
ncbi:MAG: hypothetical protein ABIF12_02595 [bacterium]